jgi:hypothetical protein
MDRPELIYVLPSGSPLRIAASDLLRFITKLDTTSPDQCWNWTATTDSHGYGNFRLSRSNVPSHRFAFVAFKGPIAEGLQLDHLCRNRACCNPLHLEPVTHRINTLRGNAPAAINAAKSACKHGHEFTSRNTIRRKGGGRRCRECERGRAIRRRSTEGGQTPQTS